MSRMHSIPETVVVVGAGRSGTKILRDLLCHFPRWGTWPCDEINYIWRYGNAREPTDELTLEHARTEVVQYIRNEVRSIAEKKSLDVVVEKTCANTLRIPFVNEVLPQAKFIHIVRDGRDVALSAQKRWNGSVDLGYLLRKARYVPLTDVPHYALRFLKDRLYPVWSGEARVAAWGPRFEGLQDALRNHELLEVCALQWKQCVEKAASDLKEIEMDRTYRIHYEDLVRQPAQSLRALSDFLEVEESDRTLERMTEDVFAGSVGNWRDQLSSDQVAAVQELIRPTLRELEYAD